MPDELPPLGSGKQVPPRVLPEESASGEDTFNSAPAVPRSSLLLTPGARPLPEYRLVQLLGRGGFGEVWKAEGPGGIHVGMKFIRLEGRTGVVEQRALDVMKNIRHAHLLPLFGAWEQEGILILAMELADRTLLDRLNEVRNRGGEGIPHAELLAYMADAARAIDYLNAYRHGSGEESNAGIQHKDIKPQNLLLVGGTVKVADFGLARVLEHTVTSASGSLTPAYTAPEFLNGQATRWSDQYCLAVTYCQLRGGRLPFEGTAMQMMAGHMTLEPNLTMLPEAERPVVARALSKQPNQRWQDCRTFINTLAALPEPRQATRPTVSESTQPVVPKRSRTRAVAWAALFVLLLGGTGLILWELLRDKKPSSTPSGAQVDRKDGIKPSDKPPVEDPKPDPHPTGFPPELVHAVLKGGFIECHRTVLKTVTVDEPFEYTEGGVKKQAVRKVTKWIIEEVKIRIDPKKASLSNASGKALSADDLDQYLDEKGATIVLSIPTAPDPFYLQLYDDNTLVVTWKEEEKPIMPAPPTKDGI